MTYTYLSDKGLTFLKKKGHINEAEAKEVFRDYDNMKRELKELQREHAQTCMKLGYAQKDLEQKDADIERLHEGWEVIARLPMSEHPSDTRNFAKRMLKGETPYKLESIT